MADVAMATPPTNTPGAPGSDHNDGLDSPSALISTDNPHSPSSSTAMIPPPALARAPESIPADAADGANQPDANNDAMAITITAASSSSAMVPAEGASAPPAQAVAAAAAAAAAAAKKKKRRPARPQVDASTLKTGELPPQTGTVFNIWYNKWSGGDREDKYLSKQRAAGRCSIARDSGYTRADKVPGSFFCLFFARGLCPRGHECEYLHRLPTLHDLFNPNTDCFGRDKHADYRDDMGGVGSFMRQNRTLYVGRIHVSDDIEEVVARHFSEWGQIDRIRVLSARGVAFVTYTNEANGQFAKEAMAHQALDHSEILNVRWATVDPNPLAQAREARKIEEQAAEAVRRALPAAFVAELEGSSRRSLPSSSSLSSSDARKRKRIDDGSKRDNGGGFGLPGYEAPDAVWYARNNYAVAAASNNNNNNINNARAGGQQQQQQQFRTPATIEAPPPSLSSQANHSNGNGNGILSASTLAALGGYSVQIGGGGGGGGNAFQTHQQDAGTHSSTTAAPLVSYGSDSDE